MTEELLVWGYVRDIEKVYEFVAIPDDISDLIYLFQHFCDQWSKQHSHPKIIIDEEQQKITINPTKCVTAFGSTLVEQGIFSWKIKIDRIDPARKWKSAYPYVGVIKDDDDNSKFFTSSGYWNGRGYQCCGGSGYICGVKFQTSEVNCKWHQKDDILEIILDLDAKTLRLIMNDEDHGIVFDNIEESKYRLALSAAAKTEFTLL